MLSKEIRLLVVDDIPESRKAITDLLFFEDDIEIVGYAENGLEAIEQFEIPRPDVITIDTHMPVMDGLSATAEICRRHPDANVVVATIHDPDELVRAARLAGAKAYLLEPVSGEELSSAIREVVKGGVHPSTLVYDLESLKEYYAGSGVSIEGLIDSLERLNAIIADEAVETDLTPLLRDIGPTETELSLDELAESLQIRLTPFLRIDLQAQIENLWHIEVERYLDELKKYFRKQERFDDFGWDNVKGRILRERRDSKSS